MSPFMIFAIILTIAYVIYYGYNFCRDIIGKKGEVKSDTQTFDMEPSQGEHAVEVVEESDEEQPPDRDKPDAPVNIALTEGEAENSAEQETVQEAINKVEDELEECEPCNQFVLNDEQLTQALAEPDTDNTPAVYANRQ